ncbi:BTB/POZ domain-containing protein [Phthorimaea operculella]|nr:BTB/POZ domain-containing protein [Phthorimaea operculella]
MMFSKLGDPSAQQSATLTDIQITDLKPHGAYMTATLNIPITENEKHSHYIDPQKIGNTTFEIRVDVEGQKEAQAVVNQGVTFGIPRHPNQAPLFGGASATVKNPCHYSLYVKTDTLPFDEEVACFFTSNYLGHTKSELPASSNPFYILIHQKEFFGNKLTVDIKFEVVRSVFFTVDKSYYYKNMYADTDLLDFELKVDDGSVKLHKFVLAASSAIFKREFSSNWKNADEGNLHVSGISKVTLENFIQYLYLRQIPIDCKELLLLGNYYQMPHLEQECIQQLVKICTEESFLEQCEFAVEHKLLKYLMALLKKIESGNLKVDDICKASFLNRLIRQGLLLAVGGLKTLTPGFIVSLGDLVYHSKKKRFPPKCKKSHNTKQI